MSDTSAVTIKTKAIFNIKKYNRNGLLEKKNMKRSKVLQSGKWTPEENVRFIKGVLKCGVNWKKLKEEVRTRTHAQIRSHAQKYFIKLCKKYNIEIKSKRKEFFALSHLNFPYRRRSNKSVVPLNRITKTDLALIKKFNFYVKHADLDTFSPKEVIFKIEKINKHKPEKPSETPKDTLINSLHTSGHADIHDDASQLLQKRDDNEYSSSMYYLENKTLELINNEKLKILKALENLVVTNNLFSSIMNVSNYDILEIYKILGSLSNLDYITCRNSGFV